MILLIFSTFSGFSQLNIDWSSRYSGDQHWIDRPLDLKILEGEIIVASETYDGNHNYDICILRYDYSGNELSKHLIDKLSSNTKDVKIIDSHTFVEICNNGSNTILSKYSFAGDTIWQETVTSISDLKLNHSNHIIGYNSDCNVFQWDEDGNEIFSVIPNPGLDTAYLLESLEIDNQNNIYITGSAKYDLNLQLEYEGNDLLLLKLDSSGNELLERTYGLSNFNSVNSMAIDSEGYIYLTGSLFSNDLDGWRNALTIKLNSIGDTVWFRDYSSPNEKYISGESIKVSSSGFVYVLAGLDWSTGYGLFINLIYDSNGNLNQSSERRIHSSGGGGSFMLKDEDNIIINCGFRHGYGGTNDISLLYLNENCIPLDSLDYNTNGESNESPAFVEFDAEGNIIILASSDTTGSGDKDILLLKVSKTELGMSQPFPIPAEGAEWNNTEIDIASIMLNQTTTRTEIIGDTLINSLLFSKVFATWVIGYYQTGECEFSNSGNGGSQINRYQGAIRTDNNYQVQFVWEDDTIVRTIYDFSLAEGDSVQIDGLNFQYYAYVEGVDTIFINDEPRKLLNIKGIYGFDDQWIEGIGSVYGLFATFDRHWEFVDFELTCYEENDVTLYAANPQCTRCDIVTQTPTHWMEESVTVYPNPISSRSVIEWSQSFQPEQLKVYDLTGRIIFSKPISNANSSYIDRSDLEKGVLVLELVDNEGKNYKQQIVVL